MKTHQWTVERGSKNKRHFETREEAAQFIAENHQRVSNVRFHDRLTSAAIEVFREGLRLEEKKRRQP